MLVFWNFGILNFWVRYLTLFCLFTVKDGFEWFCVGTLHKNIQLMLEFLKVLLLVLPLFLLYINDPPDDVICNITIYADGITIFH